MSCSTIRKAACSLFMALLAFTHVQAQTETQTFASAESAEAAGWIFNSEGQSTERYMEGEIEENRCREDAPCETDLGWKPSNFAGGADDGEGGGLVHRSGGLPVGFYADTTIGELSLDMPITASGKVSLVNMNANGHYYFGFFDGLRVLEDPSDEGAHLGFFFGEPGGGVDPNFRWGPGIRTDGGALQRSHDAFVIGAEADASIDFLINYDPADGDGVLTLEIGDDDPFEFELPPEFRDDTSTLTSFGIWTSTSPGNARPNYMEIFLDDITYTSMATATPSGDFNLNGELDAEDMDLLSKQVASPNPDLSFDLNGDNAVDTDDRSTWVKDLKKTWFGDADLNGEFNSGDFVAVFSAGKYEDGIEGNATWAEGDWDGNMDFDSGDFVAAFSDGGYERGPLPQQAVAVPEPTSVFAPLLGVGVVLARRRMKSRMS